MSDFRSNSPRRYFPDNNGRRVLIGLTIEETAEFEKLDNSTPADVRGEQTGSAAANQQQRWLELYSKHDQAWIRWMADTRARQSENLPFLN
jgi:hypothetical protein